MLPGKPLVTTGLIALLLVSLERRTRISVFTAWSPVASTRGVCLPKLLSRSIRRLPKLAALKPLHHGVGMLHLQATQCGKQLVAFGGAE
jgi:hypothetical protein